MKSPFENKGRVDEKEFHFTVCKSNFTHWLKQNKAPSVNTQI